MSEAYDILTAAIENSMNVIYRAMSALASSKEA